MQMSSISTPMEVDVNLVPGAAVSAAVRASPAIPLNALVAQNVQSREGAPLSARKVYPFSRATVEQWLRGKKQELMAIEEKITQLNPNTEEKIAELKKEMAENQESIQKSQNGLSAVRLKIEQTRAHMSATKSSDLETQSRYQAAIQAIIAAGSDLAKISAARILLQKELQCLRESSTSRELLEKNCLELLEEEKKLTSDNHTALERLQILNENLLRLVEEEAKLKQYRAEAQELSVEESNLTILLKEYSHCQEYVFSATGPASQSQDLPFSPVFSPKARPIFTEKKSSGAPAASATKKIAALSLMTPKTPSRSPASFASPAPSPYSTAATPSFSLSAEEVSSWGVSDTIDEEDLDSDSDCSSTSSEYTLVSTEPLPFRAVYPGGRVVSAKVKFTLRKPNSISLDEVASPSSSSSFSLSMFAAAASSLTPITSEKQVGQKRRLTINHSETLEEPIGQETKPNVPNPIIFPVDSLQRQFINPKLSVQELQGLVSDPKNSAALASVIDGYTPFHLLLLTGNVALIKAFISTKPVDYELPSVLHGGWTPLQLLCFLIKVNNAPQEDVSYLIRYFIEKGLLISALNPHGYNSAHLAAYNGNEKALQALLEHQSPENDFINVKCVYGYAPLHYAAFAGIRSSSVTRVLLSHNALDVNVLSDSFGRTALMTAAHGEDLEVVKLLLSNALVTFAGLNLIDSTGKTALDYNLAIENRQRKLTTQKNKNAITLLFRTHGAKQGEEPERRGGRPEVSSSKRARPEPLKVVVEVDDSGEEEKKESDRL